MINLPSPLLHRRARPLRLAVAVLFACLLHACSSGNGAVAQGGARAELEQCGQLVLVVGDGWNGSSATLVRYVRTESGWKGVGDPVPVVLGRNGLGWGRGLHEPSATGPQKREGDGRAPAGLFRITSLFGVAAAKPAEFHMFYQPLSAGVECVDDTGSRFYNRTVNAADVEVDWRSSEKMSRVLPFYRWGANVAHNTSPAVPGGGSCIFLHIWGGPAVPTSGCTAMAEEQLLDLLRWLDEAKNPMLAQLPREEYPRLRAEWGLP